MKTPTMKRMKRLAVSWLVTIVCSVALLTGMSGAAKAQGPTVSPAGQTTKGAVIKGKAPVNKKVLQVRLPKAQETTLPNGLRVILLQDHKVPTVTMQMVVLSGGLSDRNDHRGLASFTAALLREGTAKRTSKDVAEQVDTLGATLAAGSGFSTQTSTVTAFGLVENLDPLMEIFADVVRSPVFPKDEVEKYRARTLAQLQLQRGSPQFLAQEQFNRAIYGDHPASLIAPPADSIKKLSSKDLADFHATYYRPNNAILAIVGDVTLKELVPRITKAFGDWTRADVPATLIPAIPEPANARILLVDRPGSVQTVLQLGNLGIERNSPDYFPLLLANRILGGGPAARLFLNLREDKGYTYGAYSNFGGTKFRGTWVSSSEVRTDVTEGAMKEFMYELKRLRDEKVTPEELDNAKRAIVGSFALSLEQPQSLLQNIITQKLYDLPPAYWDTYPQKVAAITLEDVQSVAQKYIDLDHLQIVAVGDASKARDILAKYGKVEVYDADGSSVTDKKN
ncbi:MAG: M16 family metallopeptidase [Pyrinomonadaceae bacterium]